MKNKFLVPIAILFCLASLTFVRISAAAPTVTALTLEEVVSLKRVKTALMSPNGDAIAYLLSVPRTLYEDEDGDAWVQLHVVDL